MANSDAAKCPKCGGGEVVKIAESVAHRLMQIEGPHQPRPYGVYKCPCGMNFTSDDPEPTPDGSPAQ